jgi:hypothetical protein
MARTTGFVRSLFTMRMFLGLIAGTELWERQRGRYRDENGKERDRSDRYMAEDHGMSQSFDDVTHVARDTRLFTPSTVGWP